MEKRTFLQFIADYGVGDPSFSEVVQKFELLDPYLDIFCTSVPKFSTLSTGFWTYQFALVNPVPNMLIYTNTAPRKDDKESRIHNEGEGLVYALLNNGVRIVGVNAGYSFSVIKPHIKEFHHINVANKGSQFRSRDFYPEAIMGILRETASLVGESIDVENIPDVPPQKIAWIDGYGNMKTTVRSSSCTYKSGQAIIVSVGGMKRTAFFTDGSFSVREGELAFAPGSSGGDDRYMELFLRGLSAYKEFGNPHIETAFEIEVAI